MNSNGEYVKQYCEYLRNLSDETEQLCENSRNLLGNIATIRADLLMKTLEWEEEGHKSLGKAMCNLLECSYGKEYAVING
jgi:hypothetical protein